MIKYKVDKVERTCYACPSLWEIYVDGKNLFYVRYRWGQLKIVDNMTGNIVFSEQDSDEILGLMEFDEMKERTKSLFDFGDVKETAPRYGY